MAARRRFISFDDVHLFLEGLLGEILHAKRILSLPGATLGVIETAPLAIGAISQGLSLVQGD